jgi:CHAT domain-containing protein
MSNVPALAKIEQSRINLNALDGELASQNLETDAGSAASWKSRLDSEEDVYRLALDELRYSNPSFSRVLSGTPLGVADIQQSIAPDTVVLEYYVMNDRLLIFVVPKVGTVSCVRVDISQKELEAMIATLRDSVTATDRSYETSAKALYQRLIVPIEKQLSGRKLAIVPHGALHFLPFSMLIGGGKFLIEDHLMFTVPSANLLVQVERAPVLVAGRSLVVANPRENLQSAEAEAVIVSSLIERPLSLVEGAATKEAVLAGMRDAGIIHFATHAVLDKDNPMSSHLQLAGTDTIGIADIYGLDIHPSLVALSACETHIGKLDTGDEVTSLTRAFLFAGARSVLTTLWEVRSDEAEGLIASFYRKYIVEGLPKAEALRAAQVELIRSGNAGASHPGNWASFLLVGSPE